MCGSAAGRPSDGASTALETNEAAPVVPRYHGRGLARPVPLPHGLVQVSDGVDGEPLARNPKVVDAEGWSEPL